jgi:hypothetical protein
MEKLLLFLFWSIANERYRFLHNNKPEWLLLLPTLAQNQTNITSLVISGVAGTELFGLCCF